LLERTRVRREAAILRALRAEGVEGVAALLGGAIQLLNSVDPEI
jgi:hypothetical protein